MKQHITVGDLKILTVEQAEKLRYLWIPQKYDLAFANVCVDAENDLFEEYEFVIGKVEMQQYASCFVMNFYDISSMNQSEEENQTEGDQAESETLPEEDLDSDEGFLSNEMPVIRPSIYSLEDCLPLLSIGNMIEILSNHQEKKVVFGITSSEDGYVLTIDPLSFDDEIQTVKSDEMCDVLWKAILKIL